MVNFVRKAAPPVALIVLVFLFFSQLAFTDGILARGDTYAYFYPYWYARDAALRAGTLPLWTPDLFMGAPLLGNSQLGTFYPPNWLTVAFSPPDAIRISILIHIAWGALGMYVLTRRRLSLDMLPAFTAALVFAFGGALSARVEQINQLQGLSWLPWAITCFILAVKRPALGVPLTAIALALQFFTGHTQTVFITVTALGLLSVIRPVRQMPRALIALAVSGLIALVLTLPQLIPTLELTRMGNRSGGFTPEQATAFSFSPFAVGRGLLPSYDSLISTEYIVYIGVIGLALAAVGALSRPRALLPWLILAGVGFVLAFGLYNPLYWLLASIPPFNLFRVPARWLALFAVGMAVLAGCGLQSFSERARITWRTAAVIAALVGVLMLISPLIARLPDGTPPTPPSLVSFIGWIAALIIALRLLKFGGRLRGLAPTVLVAAAAVELYLAAGVLPFNDLTTRDAYHAGRFTQYQLQAFTDDQTAPDRFLSISDLLFDAGDRAALTARYSELGLSETAIRTAFVAIKQQEVLAANLPLIYGVPSADGFDGGLLPLGSYSAFTSLLLPEGEPRTLDGRLRELLAYPPECRGACIPDVRWLSLMNVRYLITDKVFDLWHADVAYDTQFEAVTGDGLPHPIYTPFEATALDLLFSCEALPCESPRVTLRLENGESVTLDAQTATENVDIYALARLEFPEPLTPIAFQLEAADAPILVRAATLVDTRTGEFQQTTFAPWRRVLSSDIKIYENIAALPRAFVVTDFITYLNDDAAGTEVALALMDDPNFNPRSMLIVHGLPEPDGAAGGASEAVIREYAPERVVIDVQSEAAGWLLLTDAYYPGWSATVNGETAEIRRANVMFRAVRVPAGSSEVVFTYQPAWLNPSLIAGLAAWGIIGGAVIIQRPLLSRARKRTR